MTRQVETLTPADVSARLSYDPETGILRWKECAAKPQEWNTKFAGKAAGYVNASGYVFIGLRGYGPKWMHFGHRLAWAVHFGAWPSGFIDHINGNRADNRIKNLRDVTHQQNTWNRTDAPRASSGYRGVYAAKNRWLASIMRNGRTYRLGNFSTKDEAAQARLSAERRDWTPELPVSPNNVP